MSKIVSKIKNFYKYRIRKVGNAVYYDIFDDNEIIFIHVPKTAGLSILKALFEREIRVGHGKAIEYKRLDSIKFQKYFKFGFVRNPWDRLVSSYFFLKKGGITESDRKWSRNNNEIFRSFDVFVESLFQNPSLLEWKHLEPQANYLCDNNDNILVDFTGRFENLDDDYNKIKNKLAFGEKLGLVNVTSRSRNTIYHDHYTKETKRKVADLYNRDIEIFSYKF